MNRKQFFEKVHTAVADPGEIGRITTAYWLAKTVHRGQARDNGERYLEHCRRVALALIEYGNASADELVIALAHDCTEDGFMPYALLETLFGKRVATAVDALSKITPIHDETTGEIIEKRKKDLAAYYQAIACSEAMVRRIKIADRPDNLRTMDRWKTQRKQRYLAEAEGYILPIARATDAELARLLESEIKTRKEAL